MKNKEVEVEVNGVVYLVDRSCYNMAMGTEMVLAAESGDAEKITRVANASLVKAIGLNAVMNIPINDLPEVSRRVFGALMGEK